MAVKFPLSSAYLSRTSNFLSTASDMTILMWISRQDNTTPTGGDYRTFYSLAGAAFDPQVLVGTTSDTNNLNIYIADDATVINETFSELAYQDWLGIAFTYESTTGAWNVYSCDGATLTQLLTDEIVSFAGETFTQSHVGNDTFSVASTAVGYLREYQYRLTTDQILIELQNATANFRTNLFADWPLHESTDLTDKSGNNITWTTNGAPASVGGTPVLWVQTFTDRAIMEQIQYAVIEPPDDGQTWPSGLWSMAEVAEYLDQRQNKFLKDTHAQFGIANIPVTANYNEYNLPGDWISTIRVLWIDEDDNMVELPRSDTWEADNGIPTWSYVAGTPKIFYDGGRPITIRLMPIPDTAGTLQVHYVPYSALIDGSGETFTLPSEFVPFVRYGAIADMLSKVGRAQDQSRAEYCAKRYQMGVEIARLLLRGF